MIYLALSISISDILKPSGPFHIS
uniref:Uncharacterized protein n=1 Tax=Anguilla anguilla TaxID=7936 RepID=A0A0E9S434_ANGAN